MMMSFFQLVPLAAERVVNAIPGGLLIATIAWLFLRVAGKQNSGTRFAVWFSSLVAVAGLPFVPLAGNAYASTQGAHSPIVLPAFAATVIFLLWITMAAMALTRIGAGLWKLRSLRRDSKPLPAASFSPAIQEIIAQFQTSRRVALCSSSAVSVPTAIGFFHPMILLPEWTLQDLAEAELRVVLLHEFAHLRRWDDWTNLAQKLVRTALFFHPAVWWIEKRLSIEREMACDEAVLAETKDPQAYAECLVSLAEKSFVRRGLALAQAVVGRARETSLRVARILDGSRLDSARVLRPSLGLVMIVAAGCLIVLPCAPRLIAFENDTTERITNTASVTGMSPQTPRPMVIPAALRTTEVHRTAAVARKSARGMGIYGPAKLSDLADGGKGPHDARPIIIRAAAQQDVAAPQVLFVMQTAQFDESGSAIFSICVWRVTFDDGNRQTVRQEVLMNLL